MHCADLVDPFLGRLVWIMRRAWHVIDEERLVRRRSIELLHVTYRVVRHVSNQVVAGLADPWINRSMVAEEVRRPLVGLAAHEAVEVLKAHPARPLVERPRRAVQER